MPFACSSLTNPCFIMMTRGHVCQGVLGVRVGHHNVFQIYVSLVHGLNLEYSSTRHESIRAFLHGAFSLPLKAFSIMMLVVEIVIHFQKTYGTVLSGVKLLLWSR